MDDPLKKELKLLEAEVTGFSGELMEISLEMLNGGYTEYPIYVVHDGTMEIGELLFDAGEYKVPYSIHVSMLEDFIEAGIIPEEKSNIFKIAYGDPKQFMCIFFVVAETARFVFYPFAKRQSDNN
jgi:hypothetical protein